MGVLEALEQALEEKKVRRVRTPEGVRRYHAPIGSPIIDRPELPRVDRRRSSGGAGGVGDAGKRPGPSSRSRPGGRHRGTVIGDSAGDAPVYVEKVAGDGPVHQKLRAPLSAAFKKKWERARKRLPENPDDWFDFVGLSTFHRDWRRLSGAPGPKAIQVEEEIRAMGRVVDEEVNRRLKVAGIGPPLTRQQRARVRNEWLRVNGQYEEGKWEHFSDYATRIFGPPRELSERWMELNPAQTRILIDTIHHDHPDLAALDAKRTELMGRMMGNGLEYKVGYQVALQHVLGELRPMGGTFDTSFHFPVEDVDPLHDMSKVIGGPNSGLIPYQWRWAGPKWDKYEPRGVNIDRKAMRDYNRLHPRIQKLARAAIKDLEMGKAKTEEKERGALAGTYGVRLDNGSRMLIYPHVDGTWHIYAFLPSHDYHEAERRMGESRVFTNPEQSRSRPVPVGAMAGEAGEGPAAVTVDDDTITINWDVVAMPGVRRDAPILRPENAQYLSGREAVRVQRIREAVGVMDEVSQYFPASWIETSNSIIPFFVGQSESEKGRAYYKPVMDGSAPDELRLGNDLGEERVAVHELGHRMERVLGHLRAAEWAFLWRRTSTMEEVRTEDTPEAEAVVDELRQLRNERMDLRGQLSEYIMLRTGAVINPRNQERVNELSEQIEAVEARIKEAEGRLRGLQRVERYLGEREQLQSLAELNPDRSYRESEYARPDKFTNPYTGKSYGDGPGDMYEVLSMGLEGVWTGSQPMHDDPDWRRFIVGLLAAA